jgi:hypothetical protein
MCIQSNRFWGYVAVCVQLYCRCFTVLHLVVAVLHYIFRPTKPSSSVYDVLLLYSWRNLLRCFCYLFLQVLILCKFPSILVLFNPMLRSKWAVSKMKANFRIHIFSIGVRNTVMSWHRPLQWQTGPRFSSENQINGDMRFSQLRVAYQHYGLLRCNNV